MKTPGNRAPEQPLRRRGNRLYLTIWSLLGLGAATYLALTAAGGQVDMSRLSLDWTGIASFSREAPSVTLRQAPAEPDERWAHMAQNIDNIKQRMTDITADVTQIRSVQIETDQRLTRLEQRRSLSKNEIPLEPVIQPTQIRTSNTGQSEIEGTTLDGVTRTADVPATSAQQPQTDISNDDTVLATLLGEPVPTTQPASAVPEIPAAEAKVEAPQPKVAAIVPIPGRRTFGVELAAGDSVDSLRLSWALLNERHRDLLGRLAPRYIRSGTSETPDPYRLIAGPFNSSRGARNLCARLQAFYVSCKTSAFTGTLL
ncbi:MAG: SPOR domain-containing protein [Hyphomicrobiaceae bacterium]